MPGLPDRDDTGSAQEGAPGSTPETAQQAVRKEAAITEISDADYRSFCYPCYALEEVSDRQRGK